MERSPDDPAVPRRDPPAGRRWSRRGYLAAGGSLLVAGCTGTDDAPTDDTATETSGPATDPGETSADATGTAPGDAGTPTDATGTAADATETPSDAAGEAVVTRGVTYRDTSDGPLALDVVAPADAEAAPGVVFAHGGGWIGGQRGQFEPHARRLAAAGYVSLLVSYRLSDTASFPHPVEDLAAALAWARDNADRLGVDPGRLAVGGGSAGGHLAALVATAPDAFAPEGSLAPPAALAGFNGVYDLTAEGMRTAGLVESFVGASHDEAPEQYRAGSPVEQVDGGDPPTLVLHGTADRVVPYDQATAFRDALSTAGVDVSLYTAEGAGHGFHNDDPWLSRTTDRLVAFLDERV